MPRKRVWIVDVGSLASSKAESYLKTFRDEVQRFTSDDEHYNFIVPMRTDHYGLVKVVDVDDLVEPGINARPAQAMLVHGANDVDQSVVEKFSEDLKREIAATKDGPVVMAVPKDVFVVVV